MNFFEKLSKAIENKTLKKIDLELLKKAYDFAEKIYKWQKMQNWDLYISHCIEVSLLFLDLKPDTTIIISTLLYYVTENPDITEEVLKKEFWSEVSKIVFWLKKVWKIEKISGERQISSLRKMFIAMASDLRVVLIKLWNRIQRLKSASNLPKEEQVIMAKESLELYGPISERLGIFSLKTPLEDISFSILEKDLYLKIKSQVSRVKSDFMQKTSDTISWALDLWNIKNFDISWRIKWKYSIYKKMKKKWVDDIYDLYDIFAIRILVDSVEDCYKALWIIHKNWTPLPNRFKDYIATAKANWYRSLHTVIVWVSKDSKGEFRPIEVQIRTKEMHFEAEYWVASHWSYKEWVEPWEANSFVSNLVSLEKEMEDHSEFLNQIQVDALSKRIFALTPNWDIKDLPEWAIAIDFAFSIHSDIWLECTWVQINNKSVSLFTALKNGDTVKVITRKWSKPNPSWLSWVKTNHAKLAIKKWLNDQNLEAIYKDWVILINKCLAKFWKDSLDSNLSILKNFRNGKLNKRERVELVERVWKGSLLPVEAIKHIVVIHRKRVKSSLEKRKKMNELSLKHIAENTDILIEWDISSNAKVVKNCCNPLPWDEIIWYVTRWKYIWIHKISCSFIAWADYLRFLKASWGTDSLEYIATIKVTFEKQDWVLALILNVLDIEGLSFDKINYVQTLNPMRDEIDLSISFKELRIFSSSVEQMKKSKGFIDLKMISLEQ